MCSLLVKLDLLVNRDPVDIFSSIEHGSKATSIGSEMWEKLKDLIPKQLFKLAIKTAIEGNIIARETLLFLYKVANVNCYGGDTKKEAQILDKQKEGKKCMKQIEKVQ